MDLNERTVQPKRKNQLDDQASQLSAPASDELEPAHDLLKRNKFASHLQALVRNRSVHQQSAERQLQYAIMDGGRLCPNCKKFQKDGKLAARHEKKCKQGMVYRVSLARI